MTLSTNTYAKTGTLPNKAGSVGGFTFFPDMELLLLSDKPERLMREMTMLTKVERAYSADIDESTVACVTHAALYQHPLLEEPSLATTAEQRRTLANLTHMAEEVCLNCPVMMQCLYTAVVEHDVAGYAAGTTERQRNAIRSRLSWRVAPENLDVFTGCSSGRQVEHEEVVRQRRVNPTDSLETIAERLNCSVSTIKRHLRMERRSVISANPAPKLKLVPPTREQVAAALREVTETSRHNRKVRAA
ncbi:MAG: WhiB family transcriptional regulator [Propionibacteriaceae bacterium]|jgi:AraC-like DNA-binding protein|nr:WhiB family transcriptional regulator [Propionibacteriaceae bacterium]